MSLLTGGWDFSANVWKDLDSGGIAFGNAARDDWNTFKDIMSGNMGTDAASTQDTLKLQSHLGMVSSIFGAINSAIGSFYAAKSAQYQQKSVAASYQFQSDMDAINASNAEKDAQWILEAGQKEAMQYTLRAGQEKATTANQTAARGIVGGVGSARDVAASQEIVKDIDLMTINSNASRRAWAERTRATAYENRSLLNRVSGQNAMLSANSISPWGSATTSLLGSASQISSQWQWWNMMKKLPQLSIPAGGS